ncbi:ATP-binding protein [Rubinisphaera brasiliensis]|uniref:histidine kinase n=1 Tax=Rubinisphaera brasiliensis (strain ATCC 49424 / DSM 5305 / JCM 21570 / IAM 15109 / NBRC 103401 / IFAM 1448) TaxID=756272 RepID=F0SGM1_RUBBR|nr:ATP-binding protein [Rubinisphaera brasiliensis]ADY61626.1 GAF sensor signal transduction histidine kinase [Rubinisphaera brasiliensis DSM 5305]
MSQSAATLLVIEGNDQGTRFDVRESMVIGRGSKNPIRILDTEASRVHARIAPREDGWWLEDLNSSNGTFINGQPIEQKRLESGDQIQLGRTLLLFALQEKRTGSSLVSVDLVGGSSQNQHSQIVRTFSPDDLKSSAPQSSEPSHEKLRPADVLRVMGDIAEQAVRPSMTLTDLLERVLRMILQTIHADRGCMLLVDAETGMVVPQATTVRGNGPVVSHADKVALAEQMRMPVSKSIVDYVLKTGQAVRTSDPLHDTRFDPGQSILQAGVREALCVPMQGRLNLLGVIYLDLTDPRHVLGPDAGNQPHLTDEQLRLLTAVARQCALAIENFRYQQSLVDAERLAAIGQTIATLSHHIKNILQGVRGGSYLIDMGLNQDDAELIRKGWGLVEKNQDKIYHLVMDMLTFSKERTPQIELKPLNEVVTDVFELMESRAAECGVKLVFEAEKRIPLSSFDPESLHRAVLNIVTNAIDAAEQSEDEGEVVIVTGYDSSSDSLFVTVKDNGPGIPQDLQERIFNVFESTKGARGTGIGLAVSRKILREHGGDISLTSEPDQGALFKLYWPYSNEAAEAEPSRTMVSE